MAATSSSAETSTPREIVGQDSKSTVTQAQLLHFERILLAADDISKSAFDAKRAFKKRKMDVMLGSGRGTQQQAVLATPHVKLGFGDDDSEEENKENGDDMETSVAQALAKTISALTGADLPVRFESAGMAMRWATNSILAARDKSIDDARRETQSYVLDSNQTLTAMKLMSGLNDLLSQTRTRPPSHSLVCSTAS